MVMNSYKDMSEALDTIVAKLQSGQLDIDEAVKKYDEANKLIKKMQDYLMKTKNKVQKLQIDLLEK